MTDHEKVRSHERKTKKGKITKVSSYIRKKKKKKPDIENLNNLHKLLVEKTFDFKKTDPEVRKESLDLLGDSEDVNVIPVLEFSLLKDPDPEVRKEAAEELGDLHHPTSIYVLAEAIVDEDEEVRKEAFKSLAKIQKKNSSRKINKVELDLNE